MLSERKVKMYLTTLIPNIGYIMPSGRVHCLLLACCLCYDLPTSVDEEHQQSLQASWCVRL